MASAHIVQRDDEITVIHVSLGRPLIPAVILAYGLMCVLAVQVVDLPWIAVIGMPFLFVAIGVFWVQHKTVVAMPQGIEVTYGPLPWPGTLVRAREILAIEVDANPQRYTRSNNSFGRDRHRQVDLFALFSGRREGDLVGVRPSVDAYLKDSTEVTLVNSANVRDKAHALELRDALRDGMDRVDEAAFE